MLTYKQIKKCQKTLAYLELYDDLIEEDTSNFVTNRKRADIAHNLLVQVAEKALNDKDLQR